MGKNVTIIWWSEGPLSVLCMTPINGDQLTNLYNWRIRRKPEHLGEVSNCIVDLHTVTEGAGRSRLKLGCWRYRAKNVLAKISVLKLRLKMLEIPSKSGNICGKRKTYVEVKVFFKFIRVFKVSVGPIAAIMTVSMPCLFVPCHRENGWMTSQTVPFPFTDWFCRVHLHCAHCQGLIPRQFLV